MPQRLGPFGQIHQLQAEVNRLIESLLEQRQAGGSTWQPPVDVAVDDEATVVQVELPGVSPEDLEVQVVGRSLSIRGLKSRLRSEPSGGHYHLMERFIGAFSMDAELPRPVDPRAGSARLDRGVLTVRLPNLKERRHRAFTLTVAEETEDE